MKKPLKNGKVGRKSTPYDVTRRREPSTKKFRHLGKTGKKKENTLSRRECGPVSWALAQEDPGQVSNLQNYKPWT